MYWCTNLILLCLFTHNIFIVCLAVLNVQHLFYSMLIFVLPAVVRNVRYPLLLLHFIMVNVTLLMPLLKLHFRFQILAVQSPNSCSECMLPFPYVLRVKQHIRFLLVGIVYSPVIHLCDSYIIFFVCFFYCCTNFILFFFLHTIFSLSVNSCPQCATSFIIYGVSQIISCLLPVI